MRPRFLALAPAALVLVLSACSGSGSSGDPEGFNEADVAFASDMIPHHAQALVMVDLTLGRDLEPEVAELTEQIRAEQTPEIEQMADLLEDWGEPVPETSRDHANAHGDGHVEQDQDMPGMMSPEDMSALEDASGARFEDMWLEMMIEHHEGAVTMAQDQLDAGQNGEATALAEKIAADQEREIETMQRLLQS